MANKSISELTAASSMGNNDLLVLEQNGVAKKLSGSILSTYVSGHGGIASTSYTPPVAPSLQGTLTLNFTDGTSTSVPIMNGAKGDTGAQGIQGIQGVQGEAFTYEDFTPEQLAALKGDDGNPGYCWIKWASVEPTADADMSDTPSDWMGIYTGASSTAPTAYTSYVWAKVKGEQGQQGLAGINGVRGTYIFESNNAVRGSEFNYYFYQSDLYAPVSSGWSVLRGDLIISGDTIYYANGRVDGDSSNPKFYVNEGTRFVLTGIPSGGTTSQVLSKSSDNDYDVTWKDPGSGTFKVTYGTTTIDDMSDAELNGKTLSLLRNGRQYIVAESTAGISSGTIVFTSADDDGTIYWCKAEDDGISLTTTWTNGSVSPGGGTPYDSNPAALGTASPGSSTAYARGDHIHPKPSASDIGAVAVAQGSGNAGKFLVVGSDGNVTTVTMTAWSGGSY